MPAEANMDILVVGTERNCRELSQRLGENHRYFFHQTRNGAEHNIGEAGIIFDFNHPEAGRDFSAYHQSKSGLFINTAKVTLRQMVLQEDLAKRSEVYGFNGMDGFLSHTCLEISVLEEESRGKIGDVLKREKIDHAFVDDRVGMVTPRIICMIVNEAYNTVQENTASKADIDLAMKLGTNYPYGPFEWCARIGLAQVYELLEALYLDTHDERFRISPLLKKEYLDAQRRSH